jgi:hypothetical protein
MSGIASKDTQPKYEVDRIDGDGSLGQFSSHLGSSRHPSKEVRKATMTREDKIRAIMTECIQHLQQHPNLRRPSYKSYLSIVFGVRLRKDGITVDQVCGEWDRRQAVKGQSSAELRSRSFGT